VTAAAAAVQPSAAVPQHVRGSCIRERQRIGRRRRRRNRGLVEEMGNGLARRMRQTRGKIRMPRGERGRLGFRRQSREVREVASRARGGGEARRSEERGAARCEAGGGARMGDRAEREGRWRRSAWSRWWGMSRGRRRHGRRAGADLRGRQNHRG
jgi:hypothetical protein